MDDHAYWYLTRATGLVSFVLLTASVSLGLLMTAKASSRLRRNAAYDIHRFVALLTLTLTVVHVFIVLPDDFIGFSVWQLLVPFASPYEPAFMALGVFALYLMGIVVATFYMRPLVPYAAWRAVHYATFGIFAMALAHGIGAGTDSGTYWARALYLAGGVVVFVLLALRLWKALVRNETRSTLAVKRALGAPSPD